MIPQFDPKQELSYPSRSLDTLLGIVVCVGGSVWGYGYGVDSVHGASICRHEIGIVWSLKLVNSAEC